MSGASAYFSADEIPLFEFLAGEISKDEQAAYLMLHLESIQLRVSAMKNGRRFAYYTDADTAKKIIENREVWLRSTSCMNDYSEIEYGIELVRHAFSLEAARNFWSAVDTVHAGLAGKVHQHFEQWLSDLASQTYALCLSEHLHEKEHNEDRLGRLSMWRAYGRGRGVAIVVNPGPLFAITSALETYTYPVIYKTEEEALDLFKGVMARVLANLGVLSRFSEDDVRERIIAFFEEMAISLKHAGFKEEREWRIVHRPNSKRSDRVNRCVETISGVPQLVYKVPLKDVPEEGLVGLDPKDLLNRVIIGPTEYPQAIAGALWVTMDKAGVADIAQKLVGSNIPLRQL